MYAVVGCSDCSALWVVEGRPDTSECPRCGRRRAYEKRRKLVTAEDADEARQARAALLAERQDSGDAFADLDSFAEMDARVEESGIDDETYLAGSGLDPEAVAEAGERPGGSPSRREVVLAALSDLEEPTAEAVVDYATDRGVPASYVRSALERLVRRGEVTESGGRYRRL